MNSLFHHIDKQSKTINNVLRLVFLEFIHFGKYSIKFGYLKKNKENTKCFNNHNYCTHLQEKI